MSKMREFSSGATRDDDTGKLDYEGFLSPIVLERYAQYMHENRKQSDGKLRDSDNWQKGIPIAQYMKSMWRHFVHVWKIHRGLGNNCCLEDALCALLFNVMGYLHEILKAKVVSQSQPTEPVAKSATTVDYKPTVDDNVNLSSDPNLDRLKPPIRYAKQSGLTDECRIVCDKGSKDNL